VHQQVTGKHIIVMQGKRREGNPAVLIADSGLVEKYLGWKPEYADLMTIVRHAWKWEVSSQSLWNHNNKPAIVDG